MRRFVFTPSAWADYIWFQENDKKLLKRVNALLKEAARTPFEGTGKPEPLRADLSGYWSRRINDEHRLVYSATDDDLIVIACRFHYDD
jgi:toxin YoeB